jgi:hypothetical protein
MKKVNFGFVVLLLTNFGISQAQTTLFTETFESGNSFTLNSSDLNASTTHNIWKINNSYTGGTVSVTCSGMTQTLTVTDTTAQPSGITSGPSSNYMHITAQDAITAGINCSSYAPAVSLCGISSGSNFSKMTNSISTTGHSDIKFNFWWICAGSSDAFGEVYYSLDNGTNWVLKQTNLFNTTSWTQASLTDTAWDNQSNIIFAFRFVNNTTTSTASDVPAFSIDEISVTADNTMSSPSNKSLISSIFYPNPTKDDINIILNKTYKVVAIQISDISGKIIDVKEFKNSRNLNFKLNASPGLYFLNIEADTEKHNFKIVKK